MWSQWHYADLYLTLVIFLCDDSRNIWNLFNVLNSSLKRKLKTFLIILKIFSKRVNSSWRFCCVIYRKDSMNPFVLGNAFLNSYALTLISFSSDCYIHQNETNQWIQNQCVILNNPIHWWLIVWLMFLFQIPRLDVYALYARNHQKCIKQMIKFEHQKPSFIQHLNVSPIQFEIFLNSKCQFSFLSKSWNFPTHSLLYVANSWERRYSRFDVFVDSTRPTDSSLQTLNWGFLDRPIFFSFLSFPILWHFNHKIVVFWFWLNRLLSFVCLICLGFVEKNSWNASRQQEFKNCSTENWRNRKQHQWKYTKIWKPSKT